MFNFNLEITLSLNKNYMQRMWSLLHSNYKRDTGSIRKGLNCFRSGWYWSISLLGTLTDCAGYSMEGPLHTSCSWCYMVSGSHWSHNGLEWGIPVVQESWKWSWTGPKAKTSEYHQRRKWCMMKRPHSIINYQRMKWNVPCSLTGPVLPEVEGCHMELYITSCRNCYESYESSQFAEVKVYWLYILLNEKTGHCSTSMDGGKYPMGVTAAMEEEQLAALRQTHQSHYNVERYCCLGREHSCNSTSCRCPRTQELRQWRTSKQPASRTGHWGWSDSGRSELATIRVNYFWLGGPMTFQAIKERMPPIDGLWIEG